MDAVFLNDDKIRKRTYRWPDRYLSMKDHADFSELRGLLKLAKKLRNAATETSDGRYIAMFIRTAGSLEEQARKRAFGEHGIFVPREGHHFSGSESVLN
jgi:hypothetical protein